MPSLVNRSCCSSWTSTYRSPGRAAAGADLALTGQPDPDAVADTGRDVRPHRAPGADPALAVALPARLGDDLAEAAADRAGPGGDDLAEQRPLDLLDLAGALAHVAGGRAGALGAAVAVADRAQRGGVDRQILGDTGRAFLEGELDRDQRVVALPDPGPRTAGPAAAAAAEEGVHDVAQAHAAERVAHAAGTAAATAAAERVAAQVDHLPLGRVGEHLVGRGDLLELLLGSRIRVDVGMQFPRQFAVGPLDLVRRRALGHAEQAVIVPCHPLHQLPFLRASARTLLRHPPRGCSHCRLPFASGANLHCR